MTKKLFIAGLFIFWAFVTALLTAGFVFIGKNSTQQQSFIQTPVNTNISGVSSGIQNNTTTPLALTPLEISKHTTEQSCWMLMGNKIYDVTSYLSQHPGGRNSILQYCGKDGSAVFTGLPHSSSAEQLLASYYVGIVGEMIKIDTTSGSQTNFLASSSQSVIPRSNNKRDKEDEFDD
jgi:cytochrome b involved in lipid metabolism